MAAKANIGTLRPHAIGNICEPLLARPLERGGF